MLLLLLFTGDVSGHGRARSMNQDMAPDAMHLPASAPWGYSYDDARVYQDGLCL